MPRQLYIILPFLCILSISCYKKLYLVTTADNKQLSTQHDTLQQESVILDSANQAFKTEYDMLDRQNSSLKAKESELTMENTRLIKNRQTELIQVNKAMIAYLESVASAAYAYRPPCENAANGHFRDLVATGPSRPRATPNLTLTTYDATVLLHTFTVFSKINQDAFINNQNYAPDDWTAVKKWTGQHLKDIGEFLGKALSIINSDDKDKAAAEAVVDMPGFIKGLDKGLCSSGAHGHGHISYGVRQAAAMGRNELRTLPFHTQTPAEAKIRAILESCFTELYKLDTDHHVPWLTGDWQLRYYAIMKATAFGLATVNQVLMKEKS